jgi:hypothetical protein
MRFWPQDHTCRLGERWPCGYLRLSNEGCQGELYQDSSSYGPARIGRERQSSKTRRLTQTAESSPGPIPPGESSVQVGLSSGKVLLVSAPSNKSRGKEGPWTRTIAIGTVILVVLTLIGLGVFSGGGSTKPRETSAIASKTATTRQPQQPPSTPRYLKELKPTGDNETPQTGEIQIDGQHFFHSIFYEGVKSNIQNEGPCASEGECRYVQYELGGKYARFTASFGITAKQPAEEPNGHWWVVVDGEVLRQGGFQGNRRPEQLELPLKHGHVLELRASANMGTEEANLIWGDARVYP